MKIPEIPPNSSFEELCEFSYDENPELATAAVKRLFSTLEGRIEMNKDVMRRKANAVAERERKERIAVEQEYDARLIHFPSHFEREVSVLRGPRKSESVPKDSGNIIYFRP